MSCGTINQTKSAVFIVGFLSTRHQFEEKPRFAKIIQEVLLILKSHCLENEFIITSTEIAKSLPSMEHSRLERRRREGMKIFLFKNYSF